jgi:hypothetical protein
VNWFREQSEMLLAPNTMKTYGVGESHFTVADVVREAENFNRQRPMNMMTYVNARIIRDWLKHHCRYDITLKTVRHVLIRDQTVVSAGSIPYTEESRQEEEDFLTQQETSVTLAKVDAPKVDYKQIRKEASLIARRAYKPANIHTFMTVKETQPKQDEDVNVRVSIPNPQHFKNKVRLSA